MSWIRYSPRSSALLPVPIQSAYAAPPGPSHRVPVLGFGAPVAVHITPHTTPRPAPTTATPPTSSGGPWWAWAVGGVLGAGLVLGLGGALAHR